MNQGANAKDRTWQYNLDTYGLTHVYDDFIDDFGAAAANFSARAWVDLFADAGARYFVQVSKHHDGYALYNMPSGVSQRSSVALPPHRDLLRETFDAAATYQPQLRRATYYSLPEWFSPAYAPYGFSSWPGGNATNPYTNQTLPYTGYVAVDDYLTDIMTPQMRALADMGTELIWCDIGGPNTTLDFASKWFNEPARDGRQVALNNRCGVPGDFDTPEYARYDAVQRRKWESSLGMDPFSYGYNRATPAGAYISPVEIVTSLVDIVSKNGNFLLDVGPQANGTIVEEEQRNLREAGTWIKQHEEAIFNTTYWTVAPGEGNLIWFTQTAEAFYIHVLARPNGTVLLTLPIPFVEGDKVTVMGGNRSGEVVPSRLDRNGSLSLAVSEDVADADRYVWIFKIPFLPEDVGAGNGSATPTSTAVPTATPSHSSGVTCRSLGRLGLAGAFIAARFLTSLVWV